MSESARVESDRFVDSLTDMQVSRMLSYIEARLHAVCPGGVEKKCKGRPEVALHGRLYCRDHAAKLRPYNSIYQFAEGNRVGRGGDPSPWGENVTRSREDDGMTFERISLIERGSEHPA